ncbi:MAG: iron chaperone [Rhodoluna sp.]
MAEKKAAFSAAEREAMKERARELKSAKSANADAANLADCLANIKAMPEPDRAIATRIHELVLKVAPELVAKTWYGMPAYATPGKDGKVICFFQNAQKFKVRYHTLGFSEWSKLDEGAMWPTSYALTKLTPKIETEIKALVKKAVTGN